MISIKDLRISDDKEDKLFRNYIIEKNKTIPNILYKYRSLDSEDDVKWNIGLLINDALWFSNFSEFIDKSDGDIFNKGSNLFRLYDKMLFNNVTDEKKKIIKTKKGYKKIYDHLFELITDKGYFDKKTLTDEERSDFFKTILDDISSTKYTKKSNEQFKKNHYCCCLCKNNKSEKMWDEYASNHSGFCVGYPVQNDSSEKILKYNNIFPVEYRKNQYIHHKLSFFYIIKSITRKDPRYAHEEEFRVISFCTDPNEKTFTSDGDIKTIEERNGCYYKFPKPSIVILGKNIKDRYKTKIIDICTRREISWKMEN